MAGVSEANRKKTAAALLGLGAALVLLGFLLVMDQPVVEIPAVTTTQQAVLPPQAKATLMRQVLFWLIVLLLVFAVSTIAFIRWSRRFRRWLFRKPRPPTPSEDVWAMHKLPEGAIDEWTETEPDDPQEPDPRGP